MVYKTFRKLEKGPLRRLAKWCKKVERTRHRVLKVRQVVTKGMHGVQKVEGALTGVTEASSRVLFQPQDGVPDILHPVLTVARR